MDVKQAVEIFNKTYHGTPYQHVREVGGKYVFILGKDPRDIADLVAVYKKDGRCVPYFPFEDPEAERAF